jgi:hypothetical protein
MQAFTETLNNPMFTFRQGVKVGLKTASSQISKAIVYSNELTLGGEKGKYLVRSPVLMSRTAHSSW